MLDSLAKIPKGVNIILFIWMIFGIYFVVRRKEFKDEKNLYLFLAVTGFMIAWRVFIRIITSRYAIAFILPFTILSAYFLMDSARKRHALVRLAFYALVICTSFIYLKMNFDSLSRYHYSTVLSDAVRKLRQEERYQYVVRRTEYTRTCFLNNLNEKVDEIKPDKSFENYLLEHERKDIPRLLNFQTSKSDEGIRGWKDFRRIVSLPQNEEGTKKQVIGTLP